MIDKKELFNAADEIANAFVGVKDIMNQILILPYQFVRDMYDGKRKRLRWPRGLERIELARYSMVSPQDLLRQNGVYAFAGVAYRWPIPRTDDSGKLENRLVECFYIRRRQSGKAHGLLQKYSQDKILHWRYYNGKSV